VRKKKEKQKVRAAAMVERVAGGRWLLRVCMIEMAVVLGVVNVFVLVVEIVVGIVAWGVVVEVQDMSYVELGARVPVVVDNVKFLVENPGFDVVVCHTRTRWNS